MVIFLLASLLSVALAIDGSGALIRSHTQETAGVSAGTAFVAAEGWNLSLADFKIAKDEAEWRTWTDKIRMRQELELESIFARPMSLEVDAAGETPEVLVLKSAKRHVKQKESVLMKVRERQQASTSVAEIARRKYVRQAYLERLSRQDPSVVSQIGLIGWFQSAKLGTAVPTTWTNAATGTGALPAATVTATTMKVVTGVNIGAFLQGTAADKVTLWGSGAGTVPFTICSVTKYIDNIANGAILASSSTTGHGVVLGHYVILAPNATAITGVAKLGGLHSRLPSTLARPVSALTTWLTMCATADGQTPADVFVDYPNVNVATGAIGCGGGSGCTGGGTIGLNLLPAGNSNFAAMEFIIWNRVLTATEINPVMTYLKALQQPYTTTTTTAPVANVTKAGSVHSSGNWFILLSITAATVQLI